MIRTKIEREGQKYFDMPDYATPRPIATAVAKALGGEVPRRHLIGFKRYPLNWTKPKGTTNDQSVRI